MIKKLLLSCFFLCQLICLGQEDAWIFLADKENVSQALSNPITILTQKAIDRKELHNIPIDFRDVPVNETYITQLKNAAGITVLAKSKWLNAVHVRGSQMDIDALLSEIYVDHIEYADRSLNGSRNLDPMGNKFVVIDRVSWNYGNTQNQVEMLNLQVLHEMDYTGNNMTIAVMDSGFNNVNTMTAFDRLRNAGKLLGGYDFVDRTSDVYAYTQNDHGTRVLSTMAGFVQDQFVGTAPDAEYYLFRTEDVSSENPVEESYWVEAAERADSLGVNILNTSLGYKNYDNPDYSYANTDLDGTVAFISRGANIAAEKGLLVVNSAGNSGNNGVNAPADAPGVFSIGAVDGNGDYASFSSQGSAIQPTHKPDVMARGSGSYVIPSTDVITQNNGTSFSSPILCGAAACLWQAFPEMTAEEIKGFIRQSSSLYSTPDYMMGFGIPDFELALNAALDAQALEQTEFEIFPNPVTNFIQIQYPGNVERTNFYLFDILGKLVLELDLHRSEIFIDLNNISPGIYLARFQSENRRSTTFKLLKN